MSVGARDRVTHLPARSQGAARPTHPPSDSALPDLAGPWGFVPGLPSIDIHGTWPNTDAPSRTTVAAREWKRGRTPFAPAMDRTRSAGASKPMPRVATESASVSTASPGITRVTSPSVAPTGLPELEPPATSRHQRTYGGDNGGDRRCPLGAGPPAGFRSASPRLVEPDQRLD